jgi:hypothetical protein
MEIQETIRGRLFDRYFMHSITGLRNREELRLRKIIFIKALRGI